MRWTGRRAANNPIIPAVEFGLRFPENAGDAGTLKTVPAFVFKSIQEQAMTIKVGDRIPSVTLQRKTADGIDSVSTEDFFKGRKVAVFAVPGAFTPTCSNKHLPGFIAQADALKAKGIDEIACVSVNDAFVMGAWGEAHGAGDKVTMLADGSAVLAESLGLDLDLKERGFGVRSQRYAMIVDDGKIAHLAVEEGGGLSVSSAESILDAL